MEEEQPEDAPIEQDPMEEEDSYEVTEEESDTGGDNQSKARALIGQFSVPHLPMGVRC